MNEHLIKYKSGILAGLTEVIFTHPIDFYKTQKQYSAYNGNLINNFKLRNMYDGIIPRLIGIVPMRLVFWCTQDYGEDYFKNKIGIIIRNKLKIRNILIKVENTRNWHFEMLLHTLDI